jgi:hypothetical protein
MQICEVFDLCSGLARRRACGHLACDGCTDPATNACLVCATTEPEEFLRFTLLQEFRTAWPLAVGLKWGTA